MGFIKKVILFVFICLFAYFVYLGAIKINWDASKLPNTNIDVSKLYIPKTNQSELSIANWNLQIFGDTKAGNENLVNFYATVIKNYDVVFVQEIRDADGNAFNVLCSKLSEYNCIASSRAGRSTSKEQYGMIIKKGIV